MANKRDIEHYYLYHLDRDITVAILLTEQVGNAGGFTRATTPLGLCPKNIERRHCGIANGNRRDKIPVPSVASPIWTLAQSTVTLDGAEWRITGLIGESEAWSSAPP